MKDRMFGIIGKINDALTVFGYSIWKPVMERAGIETKLTKSTEERIEYLANVIRTIHEAGGIKEIRAALGGDDGDMDELAEALIRAGIVPPPGVQILRIKITQAPMGPAPENVRSAWVGTELLAVNLPPSIGEEDFTTGQAGPPRESYAVLTESAIAALQEKSPEAAEWFYENVPPDLPVLTFGANEVEIITETD
ncbi:MAG: hypothetical protein UU81_C0010G0018 [Microgenomates group bacterium GW2011_GWC1_41_8]|uniref:Uncharacterized protein n=3 Tax=Candidatus Roizmaniibacteriota TaxID=1752723 RepID=A0A0G0T6Q3_9BACT|nr:MAG: hypothetical protein UU14_C0003G0036 [Candidatus Roizmanbacteria bacterium GW2011_GWB1_40_7]KKR94548.1 MAG: hypothetical protein UU41_C0005G0006 [Candidatus Roizmanbacteria bacterium GW2011_GWA1_41_13]KKS24235.1 MAG: hypothetical protein UU81_C0010G0018 [Microgenomates group bacterium GW2011_GWC1_41_8]OGK48431.1 MAG: hypothetical protein A3A55_04395 [Candidatus Roizmanbacteria bacterium RIFCSPLOWO2_01_FULL_40_14]